MIRANGTNLVRESVESYFDPKAGETYRETWRGTREAIYGIATAFRNAGAKTNVISQGPSWVCMVIFSYDPASTAEEVPLDRYNLDCEIVQESIWSQPAAAAEAVQYISPAQYRKDIEDAVKNGDAEPPMHAGNFPFSRVLYRYLSRGGESYVTRRAVLSRVRTISPRYAQRIVVDVRDKAYRTSTLISTFGIPANIVQQLPANPSITPPGTVWAWWHRQQTSNIIPALNKTEETQDWVFAAWDTSFIQIL